MTTTKTDIALSALEAESIYHVPAWGEGFFCVTDEGHVAASPKLTNGSDVNLFRVVEDLVDRGVSFPVTLRFPEILETRVRQLNEAFFVAMDETDYAGGYMGVYPIKVNQIRQVVEGILGAETSSGFGLECGSKAELLASLPYLTDERRLLVCNGYKDYEMLHLMLKAQRLGKNVVPVMEKESEFEAFFAASEELGTTPKLGLRVRLSAAGAGQWSESSGDDSKFGISMPDLLDLVERLEQKNLFDSLKLLHFHLGSQIDDIQALKMAVKEITRIYVGLKRRGHEIKYLDVGGGLGVNYDAAPLGGGSGGVDYSIQEYANVIVYAIKEVCDAERIAVPTIVTENGRALSAHHSVLVVEAIGSTSKPTANDEYEPSTDHHEVIHLLHEMASEVLPGNGHTFNLGRLLETYHDAIEERNNADTLFSYGYLTLEEKAISERLYWTICVSINKRIHAADAGHLPTELQELNEHLVDQVLCDFSVFQSLTDHWSIGQRFPIMPLHRLTEKPTRRCRLVDLTCDSYGTISHFISPNGPKTYIDLHPLRDDERYFLGIFLTGAYQDSLSDHHNLFGTVAEVHITSNPDRIDGYVTQEMLPEANVQSMLERVNYDDQTLIDTLRKQVESAVFDGRVSVAEGNDLLALYQQMMSGPTYLKGAS